MRQLSNSRKRDDKRLFKGLKDAEKPEDKSRALQALFDEIIDRYCGVLIKSLIPVKQWIHDEFPPGASDTEVVLKGMFKGKLQKMNDCFKNASELMRPDPVWESELETLKKYVELHGTDHSPIECVRLVS